MEGFGKETFNFVGNNIKEFDDLVVLPEAVDASLAFNRLSVAVGDYFELYQESTVIVDVLSNDYDFENDTYVLNEITQQPSKGSAEITSNTEVTYTGSAGEVGGDYFVYNLIDSLGRLSIGHGIVNLVINQNLLISNKFLILDNGGHIDTNYNLDFNYQSSASIVLKLRRDELGSFQTLLHNFLADGFLLRHNSDNRIQLTAILASGGVSDFTTEVTNVSDVLTFVLVLQNEVLSLYIDSVLSASVIVSSAFTSSNNDTAYIGRYSTDRYPTTSSFEYFGVADVALTQTQIESMSNDGALSELVPNNTNQELIATNSVWNENFGYFQITDTSGNDRHSITGDVLETDLIDNP